MDAAPAAGAEAMTEMAVEDPGVATAATDAASGAASEAPDAGSDDAEMSDTTEAPADAATEATIDSLDGAAEVMVSITSPEQLRDYARGRRAVLPLPGLGFPCVDDDDVEPIGEVSYQGVPAIVVRDPSTGTVTAYDLRGTCAVVATATP